MRQGMQQHEAHPGKWLPAPTARPVGLKLRELGRQLLGPVCDVGLALPASQHLLVKRKKNALTPQFNCWPPGLTWRPERGNIDVELRDVHEVANVEARLDASEAPKGPHLAKPRRRSNLCDLAGFAPLGNSDALHLELVRRLDWLWRVEECPVFVGAEAGRTSTFSSSSSQHLFGGVFLEQIIQQVEIRRLDDFICGGQLAKRVKERGDNEVDRIGIGRMDSAEATTEK